MIIYGLFVCVEVLQPNHLWSFFYITYIFFLNTTWLFKKRLGCIAYFVLYSNITGRISLVSKNMCSFETSSEQNPYKNEIRTQTRPKHSCLALCMI